MAAAAQDPWVGASYGLAVVKITGQSNTAYLDWRDSKCPRKLQLIEAAIICELQSDWPECRVLFSQTDQKHSAVCAAGCVCHTTQLSAHVFEFDTRDARNSAATAADATASIVGDHEARKKTDFDFHDFRATMYERRRQRGH